MAVTFGVLCALAFLAFVLLAAIPRYGRIDKRLWWYAYNRYLDSGVWRQLAETVKRRDSWVCQECGSWNGGEMRAHHLPGTYHGWLYYAAAPLFGLRENPDDLITVCRSCHEEIHGG